MGEGGLLLCALPPLLSLSLLFLLPCVRGAGEAALYVLLLLEQGAGCSPKEVTTPSAGKSAVGGWGLLPACSERMFVHV